MNEFTPQPVAWLRKTFALRAATGFDRPNLMWLCGGFAVIGLTAFGIIWNEIGSLREEVRTEIVSIREEVKENHVRITDLANSLTHIEAILAKRLPRN